MTYTYDNLRGEEAEYERQLRAAGVPDQVTVSRVVMQVRKECVKGATTKITIKDFFTTTFPSLI